MNDDLPANLSLVFVRHRRDVVDFPVWGVRIPRFLECFGLGGLIMAMSGRLSEGLSLAVACYVTAVGFSVWRSSANRRERKARGEWRAVGTGEGRLVCFGEMVELRGIEESLRRIPGPTVVRAWPTMRGDGPLACELRQFNWPSLLFVLTVGALVVASSLALFWSGPLLGWASFLSGMALLEYGVAMFGSRYLRVAPGRLEVLRPRFLSTGVTLERTIDLRHARVLCRYDTGFLEIAPGVGEDGTVGIRLDGVSDRHRFVEALFSASVSDFADIALPQDALLG